VWPAGGRAPASLEAPELVAAYVAHELRTPLATQRALLELALADPHADTGTWRQVAEDVLRACKHQEHLLEACLTLARSRAGLKRRETVDLGSIVAQVVADHDLKTLGAKVTLGRAVALGDPELIKRLVANLLANAVHHNTVGGWIRLATESTGDEARFTIENTGPAISPAELTRLFQPFRQVGLRPYSAGGLGLGLTLTKAVADAHRAVIRADARSGGGLRVEVAFPAVSMSGPGLGDG
jgi:signal transduction histidine kinase